MRITAKPVDGTIHLTIGGNTYRLSNEHAMKLAEQLSTAVTKNSEPVERSKSWQEYHDELHDLMDSIFKKPGAHQ
ncbi:hypothetical protein HW450_06625 [Corynebacterium hindlerae]|uniref:Uncharacterized protein n=1 Tax=Corynebacterium hindlerae TaxID=699041 RepID=A0A7G5FIC3_9CORY|nr:hypothetical protein [Corynebacterium hindlerae]QMV86364.1 hypothetical protein HW450_06625 [Corynebacterium hindlerae]